MPVVKHTKYKVVTNGIKQLNVTLLVVHVMVTSDAHCMHHKKLGWVVINKLETICNEGIMSYSEVAANARRD